MLARIPSDMWATAYDHLVALAPSPVVAMIPEALLRRPVATLDEAPEAESRPA